MADIAALEGILREMETKEKVDHAVLLSRAGIFMAGKLPPGVRTEAYAVMFAAILASAETATSGMKEEVEHVEVAMESSRVLVLSGGPKALVVVQVPRGADDGIAARLLAYSKRLEEFL